MTIVLSIILVFIAKREIREIRFSKFSETLTIVLSIISEIR